MDSASLSFFLMSFYEVGARFLPSTICLVSLQAVLQDLGLDNLIREMTETIVLNGFPFDFEEVQQCEQLVSRLIIEHISSSS